MYGRIIDGQFEQAPVTFVTPEGRTICNFHRSESYLKQYGFSEVVSDPFPEYDYETEFIVPSYTQKEDGTIRKCWTVTRMEGM